MRYLCLLMAFLLANPLHAVTLRDQAPKRYVVQRGDTLWTIASRYLQRPWEWKALWHANPQIQNPNRLYPGAILVLRYANHQPYLRVLSNGTVKLSPFARGATEDEAIPPVPLSDIRPFLSESLILDKDSLANAPYVVAFAGERMMGGQGDEVYVKCLHPSKKMPEGGTLSYAFFRPGGMVLDPLTKECLGYRASLMGYGELIRGGEPASVIITAITHGVQIRDRAMPNNHPEFDLFFEPQEPEVKVHGLVVDMPGGYTQGALGSVVVLNQGKDSGLKPGDVVGLYSKCRQIADPQDTGNFIKLPPERLGEAMVVRTFSRTAYALVVRSIRTITIGDGVQNP